jgi:uncharacterized protein YegP (UPF0339 family)
MKFEIYRQKNRQWRWRLRARNGKIIADSGESYKRVSDCLRGINMVRLGTDLMTPIEHLR